MTQSAIDPDDLQRQLSQIPEKDVLAKTVDNYRKLLHLIEGHTTVDAVVHIPKEKERYASKIIVETTACLTHFCERYRGKN